MDDNLYSMWKLRACTWLGAAAALVLPACHTASKEVATSESQQVISEPLKKLYMDCSAAPPQSGAQQKMVLRMAERGLQRQGTVPRDASRPWRFPLRRCHGDPAFVPSWRQNDVRVDHVESAHRIRQDLFRQSGGCARPFARAHVPAGADAESESAGLVSDQRRARTISKWAISSVRHKLKETNWPADRLVA